MVRVFGHPELICIIGIQWETTGTTSKMGSHWNHTGWCYHPMVIQWQSSGNLHNWNTLGDHWMHAGGTLATIFFSRYAGLSLDFHLIGTQNYHRPKEIPPPPPQENCQILSDLSSKSSRCMRSMHMIIKRNNVFFKLLNHKNGVCDESPPKRRTVAETSGLEIGPMLNVRYTDSSHGTLWQALTPSVAIPQNLVSQFGEECHLTRENLIEIILDLKNARKNTSLLSAWYLLMAQPVSACAALWWRYMSVTSQITSNSTVCSTVSSA